MTDCIFCKVIAKELPSRTVFEDDGVMAFYDINPKAPVHALVVPKKHIVSINDLREEDTDVIARVMRAAPAVAEKLGVRQSGYKLVFNVGRGGGQVVDHIHMHVLAWPKAAADTGDGKEVVPV
ncbi:MAG: histidine triad nucleotide-binding protein [Patescibacteria group bacterium]